MNIEKIFETLRNNTIYKFIAAEGSLLFLTLCIHSPQSFARVMYSQNLDFWEDVCAKYSGGAMFVNFEGEVDNLKL